MGRFMVPVCCVCGRKSDGWHKPEWEDAGGLQDFCPENASEFGKLTEYVKAEYKRRIMSNPNVDWGLTCPHCNYQYDDSGQSVCPACDAPIPVRVGEGDKGTPAGHSLSGK